MNVDWSQLKLLIPYSPVNRGRLMVNGGRYERANTPSEVAVLLQKAITVLREGGEIVLEVEIARGDDIYTYVTDSEGGKFLAKSYSEDVTDNSGFGLMSSNSNLIFRTKEERNYALAEAISQIKVGEK